MIFHPAVLSLLVGSFFVSAMVLLCSLLGIKIITRWDIESSSAEQLELERKTYLISTLMNYVLGFEVLSVFLFIYTVDDIHTIFTGAMCATGSLNANPIGWYLLYTKIAVFFLAATWIAINYVDQRAEDYPLVRFKYKMVLVLAPLLLLDAALTYSYFVDLKPNVITSCCGALFSDSSIGVAASLSSLPVVEMMVAFYVTVIVFLGNGVGCLIFRKRFLSYLLMATSMLFFVVSIASIISFISLYFYEMPTHHCPFDILQKGYNFIGYPIYICLFGGTFLGFIGGASVLVEKKESLRFIVAEVQKKWITTALVLVILFTLICTWGVVFSNLSMLY
ncbi:MAG: hypothetical protein ABFS19_09530 [Thermodesulfobacteriota bacterium]